jgi:hypothetical protein
MNLNPLKNRKLFCLLVFFISSIWYVQSSYLPKTIATAVNLIYHQSVHLSGISGTLFSRSFKINKIAIHTDHVDIHIDQLSISLNSFTLPININKLAAHAMVLQINNQDSSHNQVAKKTLPTNNTRKTSANLDSQQNTLLKLLEYAAKRPVPQLVPMNINHFQIEQVTLFSPINKLSINQLSANLELMTNFSKPLSLRWQTASMLNPAKLWIERQKDEKILHLNQSNVHDFAMQIKHQPHKPIYFKILKPNLFKGTMTGHGQWPNQAMIQAHHIQLLMFKQLNFSYQAHDQMLIFNANDPTINFSVKLHSQPAIFNMNAQIRQLAPWQHDLSGACSIQLQKNHLPTKWQANCSNLHFKSWQISAARFYHQQGQTDIQLSQIHHPVWNIHHFKAQLKSLQNYQNQGTFSARNDHHQINGEFKLAPQNSLGLVIAPTIQFDHQDIPIYVKAKSPLDFQLKALNVPIKYLAGWIKTPDHLTLNPVGNINVFLLKTSGLPLGSGHIQLNDLELQSHKKIHYALPKFSCIAAQGNWNCQGQINAPNHGELKIDVQSEQEKIIIQNQFQQFRLYQNLDNHIDVDGSIKITLDHGQKNIQGLLNLSNGKIINPMTSSDHQLPEETVFYHDSKVQKKSSFSGKIQVNFQSYNQINLHGLTGQLSGQLRLLFVPANSFTEATGALSIDNPKLENIPAIKVTQFRLSYHHQPLTNPYLDIRLTRDLQPDLSDNDYFPTTINLNILGALSSPYFRINSDDQSLTDHQSLMALLTGDSTGNISGMDQVGQLLSGFNYTSSNPISMLQAIAHLDQLTIKPNLDENDQVGANIKVGKSITKKILLSYEINSHNENYNASLQYLISQLFNIQLYKTQDSKGATITYQKNFN